MLHGTIFRGIIPEESKCDAIVPTLSPFKSVDSIALQVVVQDLMPAEYCQSMACGSQVYLVAANLISHDMRPTSRLYLKCIFSSVTTSSHSQMQHDFDSP